jgi:hypothetical protein
MSQGFAYYRFAALSAEQNLALSKGKLQMPVLALEGKSGVWIGLLKCIDTLARNAQGGEIDDCGH